MHHSTVSTNYAWLPHNIDPIHNPVPAKYKDMVVQPLGDRQAAYKAFLDDCIRANGKQGMRCKDTENDRIETIMRQPIGMENYTEIGFKKIKAPTELYKLIKDFWMANKDKGSEEVWSAGNTYTNSWISRSDLISIYDTNLRGGGENLKNSIHDAARDIISEWTGQELTPCSLYGIRAYHNGAILSPHVDRLPLVSSAIICVDQDLDEPWPLEVIGHDGRAYNVSMEPGDMVLYESHSIIHGRPYPMKGRYMANIFIHFEPTGHSARHNANIALDLDQSINAKYREAVNKGHAGHENDQSGVPPYILRGSPEEALWKSTHPNGVANQEDLNKQTTGSTQAHHYAREGNVELLKKEVSKKKEIVNVKDVNGFTPLHEGVLGRNLDVVKFLVENGANVNVKTANGGGTALWWAKHQRDVAIAAGDGSDNVDEQQEETDPIILFLESVGGLEVGPDL
jgi:prolyl 4-hydroxylase